MTRLRITRPLFSDSARGRISGLGSFRAARSGTHHLVVEPFPKQARASPDPVRAAHLGAAKKLHAQIPPTKVLLGGKWRWLILPEWPAYWAQYQADNGLDFGGYVASLDGQGGLAVSAAATHDAATAAAPALQVALGLLASAVQDAATVSGPALQLSVGVSAQAHFQDSSP